MRAHFSDLRAVAAGIKLLRTIAPGTPTPFFSKFSSVRPFSRSETSGMPQKLVSDADSSTALAKFAAPSPVMSLKPTLRKKKHTSQVSGGADGGESMGGSVLEGSEGLVLFEALCKVLCGLIIKVIIVQTA